MFLWLDSKDKVFGHRTSDEDAPKLIRRSRAITEIPSPSPKGGREEEEDECLRSKDLIILFEHPFVLRLGDCILENILADGSSIHTIGNNR